MGAERATRTPRAGLARAACLALTVALGLATRKAPGLFPGFVAEFGGDTLYATLWVQLLGGVAWARGRRTPGVMNVALAALALCFVIEGSQAIDIRWLDALRRTTFGALVLGRGFLVSDLACYTVGVALGGLLERALRWP